MKPAELELKQRMKITDYNLDYPEHEGNTCPNCGFEGAGVATSLCWDCNYLVCFCGKCGSFTCLDIEEPKCEIRM